MGAVLLVAGMMIFEYVIARSCTTFCVYPWVAMFANMIVVFTNDTFTVWRPKGIAGQFHCCVGTCETGSSTLVQLVEVAPPLPSGCQTFTESTSVEITLACQGPKSAHRSTTMSPLLRNQSGVTVAPLS